jgi:hypothetical protein
MTTKAKFILLTSAAALLILPQVHAGIITQFGFTSAGNIDEAAGWNGTTGAAGGSINANVSLTELLNINGTFQPGGSGNRFHVDNWHSTINDRATQISLDNSVSFTVSANAGYALNLAGGTFSTVLHDHFSAGNPTQMFDRVALFINGVDLGDQNYTKNSTAQNLSWSISNLALNSLTSAQAKLYFWDSGNGANDPVGDNLHGPEWNLNDSANIILSGDVVPVPEPATVGIGVALIGLSLIRRRR